MKVVQLSPETQAKLRSNTVISSVEDAARELIYNSIDANATLITLSVDYTTLNLSVTDNGCGISPEDVGFVGKRHYTSKGLTGFFGFRGEALSSLAAVATVEITTKKDGRVRLFRLNSREPAGLSNFDLALASGTRVSVADLFVDVPVKRKHQLQVSFVRRVEDLKAILVEALALRPGTQVHCVLKDYNNSVTFSVKRRTKPSEALPDLLREVYGLLLFPSYELVSASYLDYSLRGVIGNVPAVTKDHQFILANGRRVFLNGLEAREINAMFKKNPLLSPSKRSRHPVFLLSLTFPENEDLDPRNAVLNHWLVLVSMVMRVVESFARKQGQTQLDSPKKSPRKIKSYIKSPKKISSQPKRQENPFVSPEPSIRITRQTLDSSRVVKQIFDRCILMASPLGLFVVDQHACDERIKVEQILEEFITDVSSGVDMRAKKEPESVFAATQAELQLLSANMPQLERLGFDLRIHNNQFAVTHVPAIVLERVEDFSVLKDELLHYVHDLENNRKRPILNNTQWFRKVNDLPCLVVDLINSKACRSSIMFGDILTADEMSYLVKQLQKCQQPFECAHGRPTVAPLPTNTLWPKH